MSDIVATTTIEKEDYSFGPQHDFRVSHEERAQQALEFFRAELPDARVTMHVHEDPAYVIVIEECDHTQERIDSLGSSLNDIVASPKGIDHYEDGGDVYFSA